MKSETKLIVFDLDGTLNRTELFAVEVHRMLQTEFGWPAQSPEEITAIFGAPAEEYMDRLLPGSDEKTKQRYLKREAEVEYDYMHLAAAYDGCARMLSVLRENGWETAVCSNSSFRYISMILNSTGLMHQIDYIQPLEKGMTEKSQSPRFSAEAYPSFLRRNGGRYCLRPESRRGQPYSLYRLPVWLPSHRNGNSRAHGFDSGGDSGTGGKTGRCRKIKCSIYNKTITKGCFGK